MMSKYLTNQDPGYSAAAPLCSQVLALLMWKPGDVRVVPREGLMMGKRAHRGWWIEAIG